MKHKRFVKLQRRLKKPTIKKVSKKEMYNLAEKSRYKQPENIIAMTEIHSNGTVKIFIPKRNNKKALQHEIRELEIWHSFIRQNKMKTNKRIEMMAHECNEVK